MSRAPQPRLVVAAAAVWLGLWGLWLLLAGSTSPTEVGVGAAAAALVLAAALRIVGVAGVAHLAPPARWWLEARHVPVRVLRDTVLVLGTVWRPPAGSYARRCLPQVASGRRERARRTLLTLLLSIAPNTIVVGFEDGRMLVHQLRPRGADLEVELR